MPNTDTFWDRVANRYAARPISNPQAYAETLERVRAHLKPDDQVLELGCGTGSTALLLADAVARITATDASREMIAIAAAKPNPTGNVTFRQVDASQRQDDESLDAVLAFNLLHLLTDTGPTLSAVHAALKPGGVFISKTPCIASWVWSPAIRLVVPVLQLFGKAPPVRFLTTRAIEEQIATAGFEIIETGDYPKSPPGHLVVARKA